MTEKDIPLILRRKIEAEILERMRSVLNAHYGEETALSLLAEAIDQAAFEAGQAFRASTATPGIQAFAKVLDVWTNSGALEVANVRSEAKRLSFEVTRCDYAKTYADMGLSQDMACTLSCRRDAAFARGYSSHLRMERGQTIAQGSPKCDFTFVWDE